MTCLATMMVGRWESVMEPEKGRHRGLVIAVIFVLACAFSYSLGRTSGQLDEKEALMSQPLPEIQVRAADHPSAGGDKQIELGSAQ
jgi:hypothetical protein